MSSSDRIRSHALAEGGRGVGISAPKRTKKAPTVPREVREGGVHPIDVVEDTFDPVPPNYVPKFVCDFSLFRVAKSMRLLGYDIRCEAGLLGDSIIHVARAENRIVITGSTRMLPKLAKMRKDDIEYRNGKPPPARVVVGYDSDGGSVYETESDEDGDEDYVMSYVKVHSSDTHDESMLRVLQTLALPWDESRVFTRCVDCNVLIESVPRKEDVEGLVPSGIYEIYSNFYHCTCCKKVYWGVDNGVAVNYKSVRTIEYLRQYRGAFANGGKAVGEAAGGEGAATEAAGRSAFAPASPGTAGAANSIAANMPASAMGGAAADANGSVLRSHNGAPVDTLRSSTRVGAYSDFTLRRHFSSLPRSIKSRIFSYMVPTDILAVSVAVPTTKQLAEAAAKGEVFCPNINSRQLRREYRKRQLTAAQQTSQAPFVRGLLKTMLEEESAQKQA